MVQYIDKAAPEHLKEKQGENPIYNVPSREVILAIWDLGNEWKELTNYDISTEHGTQLDYIQKRWKESEYYLRAKQGEKKPDNIIDEGKAEMDYCFTKMMKEEKVTPAWSEKDEEIISMLIELVEYKEESMEAKVEFIAWLKSLKSQKQCSYNPYKATLYIHHLQVYGRIQTLPSYICE